MFATLRHYLESKRGTLASGNTIADYVLELEDEDLQVFEDLYQEHYQAYQKHLSTYADSNSVPPFSLPLEGKNVLFNQHQDRITWLFMLYYQALGANVEASKIGVAELPFARDAFTAAGIPFFQENLDPQQADYCNFDEANLAKRALPGYYDLAFDCGAGLLRHTKPKNVIELTCTNPRLYTLNVSGAETINNSITKLYETYFGTGRAMVDSLKPLIRKKLDEGVGTNNRELDDDEKTKLTEDRFSKAYYVVIGGAGKVAAGVIYALLESGVPREQILLVDDNKEPFAALMPDTKNLTYLSAGLEEGPAVFKAKILEHMQKTKPNKFNQDNFLKKVSIVTATGVPGLLTKNKFKPEDLNECSLINVGHHDEAGSNFKSNDMMGATKGPINFNLRRMEEHGYPTEPKYVLPSLALMSLRGIDKLTNPQPSTTGLKDIPFDLDMKIFEKMCAKNDPEALKLKPIAEARKEALQNHAIAQPIITPDSPTRSLDSSTGSSNSLVQSPSSATTSPDRKRDAAHLNNAQIDSPAPKKAQFFSDKANNFSFNRAQNISSIVNSNQHSARPGSPK